MKSGRPYTQTARAEKSRQTEQKVLDAAEHLFAREPFDRVTLDAVARAAGVSVPTLQRRFVNKEGLFAAVGDRVRERVGAQRGQPPADRAAAVRQLVEHYEAEGRFVWHLLRQEADVPGLAAALHEGRAVHRQWVEAVFGVATDALIAATDLYVWKLLRLDLGRSPEEVGATMLAMATAVAEER